MKYYGACLELSDHDLSQLDEEEFLKLPEEVLRRLSVRVLNDLKEARERLNRNSRNSSRPPSSEAPCSEAPWEKERTSVDSTDEWAHLAPCTRAGREPRSRSATIRNENPGIVGNADSGHSGSPRFSSRHSSDGKTLLSINNYFYRRGGAEVVFLEHNRLFEGAGWRVVPFAMRHENNFPTEWESFFPEEIEFGRDYSLIKKVKNAFKITHSVESAEKVAALVDYIAPSVAHAHNVYHHLSPSIFRVLKNRGLPVVLTLHDLKLACPAYKMLARDGICERCKGGAIWNVVAHRCVKDSLGLSAAIFMETAVQRTIGSYSRYVDRFVVPSRFYIEKFVEWGWDRARFVYIPNFVDVTTLQPAGAPGKSFVFVGRLGQEKGVGTFIRALAQSGCAGVIVGTGPEEERLKGLAARLGASVQFLGYRTGEDLFDTIRTARALVLPSEWYENAPMSIMEAYALERPVIGARIGGIPELIREGETGVTFESGNSEALASVLADFKSRSAAELQGMGNSGRQWMERNFSDLRYRDRVLALYQTMGVV